MMKSIQCVTIATVDNMCLHSFSSCCCLWNLRSSLEIRTSLSSKVIDLGTNRKRILRLPISD